MCSKVATTKKSSNENFILSQYHHLPLDLTSLLIPLYWILHPSARCPKRHCFMLVKDPLHVILPPSQTHAKLSGAPACSPVGEHPCAVKLTHREPAHMGPGWSL